MTESQPDTSDVAPDHPHLNQMGAMVVASLCMDALRIAGSSAHVRAEVEGFKQSRSAWDATRLANALYAWDPGNPEASDMIQIIDREATQTAGFELTNKMRRAR